MSADRPGEFRIVAPSSKVEPTLAAQDELSMINLSVGNSKHEQPAIVEYRQSLPAKGSVFNKNKQLLDRLVQEKFTPKIRFKRTKSPTENYIADLIQSELPYNVRHGTIPSIDETPTRMQR